MGNVNRSDPKRAQERVDLELQLLPQLGVKRRKRLVHQEHAGLNRERPRQRNTLLLAA